MEIQSFSSMESSFLSKLNEGHRKFEDLQATVPFNEKTLLQVIENLLAKHVIVFNKEKNEYDYATAIEGEKLILDGNLMLPTTIIKTATHLLVSRGEWYKFPLDFDVRRIIWNVKLPSRQNSTLVDLIKDSVLKEKKSKIVQSKDWEGLRGKILPYSDNIKLLINVVGETLTDVTMIFFLKLAVPNSNSIFEYRGFTVRSEIDTEEMLAVLRKKENQNFQEIRINTIFNFSDFVFSNNEIPYLVEDDVIHVVKISSIRSKIELNYFDVTPQEKKKIDSVVYPDINEGIAKLKELFGVWANSMLTDAGLLIEMGE